MGRFRQISDEGEDQAIDISPLIDVVFILLIFFIVSTTFVENAGIPVDKPQAGASAGGAQSTTIVLKLDATGQVTYEGRSIGIAGIQSEVRRVLDREDAPVIVQVTAETPVVLLTQVMDEARLGGADLVSLAPAR